MAFSRARWVGVIAAGLLATGILAAAATLAYTLSHPAPARLRIDASPLPSLVPSATTGAATESPCAVPAQTSPGTYWTVQPGSQVGYRAHEKFGELDLPHEAVARTSSVQGFLVIEQAGSTALVLTSGCVAADVRTLESVDQLPPPLPDATGRDQHYPELLDTVNHPFVLFRPDRLELPRGILTGSTIRLSLTGALTIRGNSRQISTRAEAKLVGKDAQVVGAFVINAPDFGVRVPPSQPAVQPDITLEFLLRLASQ